MSKILENYEGKRRLQNDCNEKGHDFFRKTRDEETGRGEEQEKGANKRRRGERSMGHQKLESNQHSKERGDQRESDKGGQRESNKGYDARRSGEGKHGPESGTLGLDHKKQTPNVNNVHKNVNNMNKSSVNNAHKTVNTMQKKTCQ